MLVEKSDEQWTHPSSQAASTGEETHHGALHDQREGREKLVYSSYHSNTVSFEASIWGRKRDK